MYVFVYGTLKKGQPNHHWLTDEAKRSATYVEHGKLMTKYPLVVASKYNIPFLLDKPGVGEEVEGEIYEIDAKMLENLDILEGYPKLYNRRIESISVTEGDTSKIVECWTYILEKVEPDMLNLPMLSNYASTKELPYVASDDDLDDAKDI